MGIGYASAQSKVYEQAKEIDSISAERDDLESQLNDRQAKQAADRAAADRIEAEREQKEREAAERQAAEEKAAADRAAADQAAAEKAAADQAAADAAAEAARNTIGGSGIYEIGAEKNPGTYRTSGPTPGRSSCYYAVLSSPTGSGIDNIIDNNNIGGPGIVNLAAGQFFETTGCEDWTRS
jgi:membrane protein involved in colicin uptake